MLHLETITSPAIFAMLAGCVLGMGFLVWFLRGITLDAAATRHPHVRPEGVHYAADTARAPYRQTTLDSTAHLAMGVVRITTALTSTTELANQQAAVNRLHLVMPRTRQDFDFTSERRYRSG